MEKEELKNLEEIQPADVADTTQPVRGRAAYIQRWRERNPEAPELDDDGYFDDAGSVIDDLTEKYGSLNALNQKLADVLQDNPDFAEVISMVLSGVSVPRAFGEVYGDILSQLDEESLAEFEAGRGAVRETFGKRKSNAQAFKAALDKYALDNSLSDERKNETLNAILDMQQAFLDFDISPEVIEIVDKGFHAEEDKAELVEELNIENEANVLHTKNATIEDIKRKKAESSGVVDLVGVAAEKTTGLQGRRLTNKGKNEPVDLLSEL